VDVLVVNVGSSTVKLQVVDERGERTLATELPAHPDASELDALISGLPTVGAVGHRIVHGGPDHTGAELVTDELLDRLDEVAELAPLHDPPALEVVRLVRRVHPELPAVACYDTAFHASIPPAARLYALPPAWEDRWGIRRYGFHGLSHRYASHRAAELVGRPVDELRVVVCHLGAGASLAAVAGGVCVDTTMGFTPLEGLVMATRSGDVDPGALLWLQQRAGLDAATVEHQLWHEAGLAGLSRRSGDMREVLAGADQGDERCRLALDVYVHRLRGAVAAMVASLGGLDVLVFTGGVGEAAPRVRAEAATGLGFLGVGLDERANRSAGPGRPDVELTAPTATVRTLVVHAREDLEIDRQVRRVLASGDGPVTTR
jgi:acetate kinase